jgi:hypothetical protein
MLRTKFGLTTPPVEIAAVRSKNEFFEVPLIPAKGYYVIRNTVYSEFL